jgi:hypothetical protein
MSPLRWNDIKVRAITKSARKEKRKEVVIKELKSFDKFLGFRHFQFKVKDLLNCYILYWKTGKSNNN